MRRILSLLLIAFLLVSCSTGKRVLKCNGKRGERVPMGIL